jgi:imidazolonepropionase-like amidohydrolase
MKCVKKFIFIFISFSIVIVCLGLGQEDSSKCLVIIKAKLIDGTGALPLEDAVIVITNGKFGAIGPQKKVVIPKGAEIIDVKGKTVIPGLIDAHVHFTYPPSKYECFLDNDSIASFRAVHFLHRHLMIGVTTVRDVVSRHNVGIMAKKAFGECLFVGSRPIVVGMGVTCTGGHGMEDGGGRVVEADGPAEFRRAVRLQLKAGADLIKVLPPYSREEIEAAVEETHYYGRLVTVHSGHSGLMLGEYYDFVRWAVEAGADCIEHAFAIPDDVIEMMAEKGTYCVPTFDMMLWIADKVLKEHPGQEEKAERWLNSVHIFRKMKELGVKMGVGTDAVREDMVAYPWMYFEEIERFVEHGYTPLEVIVAATKINAEVCGASERLGTVEEGKLADLVVVDGDPLRDIKALRNTRIIIQEGKIIKN